MPGKRKCHPTAFDTQGTALEPLSMHEALIKRGASTTGGSRRPPRTREPCAASSSRRKSGDFVTGCIAVDAFSAPRDCAYDAASAFAIASSKSFGWRNCTCTPFTKKVGVP